VFGGSAWEPTGDGQWYLHLFDPSQPDWNWGNPAVVAEFDSILRFWFDRGVDGIRIDVADTMAKDPVLPDLPLRDGEPVQDKFLGHPFYDQPGVHAIHQRWRAIADSYTSTPHGARVFVAEAWRIPADRLARYVRPGQLHTVFNFEFLMCGWDSRELRAVIDRTMAALGAVGAPATWVLSNHDTIRHRTRYGRDLQDRWASAGAVPCDLAVGRRRARAALLLQLALPGTAYIYQGDELGLPEVEDLPLEALADPTWERSGHTDRGRDGCRIPLPWSGTAPPYGFGPGPGQPWLPQPTDWDTVTVAAQSADPASHLALYTSALIIRRSHPALGDGHLSWDTETSTDDVLSFTRQPGFRCLVNLGAAPVPLPPHQQVLLASEPVTGDRVPPDAAVWLDLHEPDSPG